MPKKTSKKKEKLSIWSWVCTLYNIILFAEVWRCNANQKTNLIITLCSMFFLGGMLGTRRPTSVFFFLQLLSTVLPQRSIHIYQLTFIFIYQCIYIHLSMYLYWWINWDGKQWYHSRGFTFWWWLEKVIRGKDKTNINKLIMMDCAANIFTVMIHTFNQTPLIKLRSTFLRWHNPVSLTSGFVHYKHAAAIYFTVVIIDFHLMR